MGAAMRRVLLLALVLWLPNAQAHLLNMTRAGFTFDERGALDVQLQIDLTRAAGGGLAYHAYSQLVDPLRDAQLAALLQRAAEAIVVDVDGVRVPLRVVAATLPDVPQSDFVDPLAWPMSELQLSGELPVRPGAEIRVRFSADFIFEEPIAVSLRRAVDDRSLSRWLVTAQTSPALALDPTDDARPAASRQEPAIDAVLRYLRFGFAHIVPLGIDHVLFVLGLYLGARRLRSLLWLITSFTVAHSLTLILSSYGAIRAPAAVVEPLIAASIVWVGVENLLRRDAGRWRIVIVFAFGLLHGLGFAAVLRELGLPTTQFVAALVSFNVGVELGQLVVVAVALLITGWLRQRPEYRPYVVVPGSLAIAAVAALWTVQRLA